MDLAICSANQYGTTNARYTSGHTWTYAGSIHFNLEGRSCDCGYMIFHTEPCSCCKQLVRKDFPNPNFNKQT